MDWPGPTVGHTLAWGRQREITTMEMTASYGQFCPVAMAAEIVCTRWTALVLRELLCGSQRFNELRRGVPRMSPTLLSKRLKELEHAGIVTVARDGAGGALYSLTTAGEDLREVVMMLGFWGQRWIETQQSLTKLDPSLLMWDMRRHLDPTPIPPRRCAIQFHFGDLGPAQQDWWLVVEGRTVDLCSVDPGFEVDLYVSGPLRSMTAVWMGLSTVQAEVAAGRLEVTGDRTIARTMQQWLGLSPFAKERNRRAA
jgi:DNA-binding HxlR family transcriptional regulator